MGIRVSWEDFNAIEAGHRVYRSSTPMDPEALPTSIAELGPDVTFYDDGDVTALETYYYRVSAYLGSSEFVSDEITLVAEENLPFPMDNLIAFWDFEEASGTTILDATGNHNGTLTDVAMRSPTGGVGGTGGITGNANPGTAWANLPSGVNRFGITGGSIGFNYWVFVPETGDVGVAVMDMGYRGGSGNSNNQGLIWFSGANGVCQFRVETLNDSSEYGGARGVWNPSITTEPGWNMVTCNIGIGYAEQFIQNASGIQSDSIVTSNSGFSFDPTYGADNYLFAQTPGTSQSSKGTLLSSVRRMDKIGIWQEPLDAAARAALWNFGNGNAPP